MAEVASISLDVKSLDGIKRLLEAAPKWLEEVARREATESEKHLFAAFLDLQTEDPAKDNINIDNRTGATVEITENVVGELITRNIIIKPRLVTR